MDIIDLTSEAESGLDSSLPQSLIPDALCEDDQTQHKGLDDDDDNDAKSVAVARPLAANEIFTHRFQMKAISGDLTLQICDVYDIVYTSSVETLRQWAEALPIGCSLGFDTEGDGHILQLCCLPKYTIIIFVMPDKGHSSEVKALCKGVLTGLFSSSLHLKIGIAAFDDALRVRYAAGLDAVKGIFDLAYLATDLKINAEGEIARIFRAEKDQGVIVVQEEAMRNASVLSRGLKGLYRTVFNSSDFHNLEYKSNTHTPYMETTPNLYGPKVKKWKRHPLPLKDLAYAAKDALFGSLLYNNMITRFSEAEIKQLIEKATVEYERRTVRRDSVRKQQETRQKELAKQQRAAAKRKASAARRRAKQAAAKSRAAAKQSKKNDAATAPAGQFNSPARMSGRMMTREEPTVGVNTAQVKKEPAEAKIKREPLEVKIKTEG